MGALIVAFTAGLAIAQVDYVVVPKPKLGAKVGLTKKNFDEIKAGLEQNTVALIDGTIPNRECLEALQDLQYDKETWKMVEAYLTKLPTKLPKVAKDGKSGTVMLDRYHRLYLVCRLTEPLVVSKPDVILDASKTVADLESNPKYCQGGKLSAYMSYPPCSFLDACRLPSTRDENAFNKADQARQKKSTAEQPAVLTNQYIGEFENIYCRLMAFAGDAGRDKQLFDWIVKNESGEKNYVWKMGTDAFITEAASGDMSKEHATKLYDDFLKYGKRRFQLQSKQPEIQWPVNAHYKDTKDREITAEWVYRWYFVRYLPEPNLDQITPDFTVRWDYPSYSLLTAAKYMDMVIKGIKDPTNKTLLLVHNPGKSDSPTAKPEERKWKDDPEHWTKENTLHEKPYKDMTGVVYGEDGKARLDPKTGQWIPVK
jgi:hypothetical protein